MGRAARLLAHMDSGSGRSGQAVNWSTLARAPLVQLHRLHAGNRTCAHDRDRPRTPGAQMGGYRHGTRSDRRIPKKAADRSQEIDTIQGGDRYGS